MTGYLKGSAATRVDEAIRPHQRHRLEATPREYVDDEDGQTYEETFLVLRCADCDADLLELDE